MLINLWISGGSTGLWTARVSMGSSTSLSIEKVLLLVVGIVLQSEIHLSEPWISLQYLSSSGEHDMSMFNDVGTMRDLQAALDALFDQQGGHALAVYLFDRRDTCSDAQLSTVIWSVTRDVFAAEHYVTLPERKLSRESPNQRRLPRTVESDEGDDLSFADVERDIEQGLELPVGRAHMGHAEVYWPVSAHRSRLSSLGLGSTTTRGLLGTLIAVQRLCRQRTAGYRKLLYRHQWLCHREAAGCRKLLYRHQLYREARSVSTGSFRSASSL